MNKLSPPIIANKLPAFNTKELDIAFNITRAVAPSDFTGVKVLIKTVQNNQIKLDAYFDTIYRDIKTNEFHVRVNLKGSTFNPMIGQYYKV
jgi:hypothetical protein